MTRKRIDWHRYIRNAAIGLGIWVAITVPLACAAASVDAQVLGKGPVIAPTPQATVEYIVITEDPMPRLYGPDTYLPYAGKGE